MSMTALVSAFARAYHTRREGAKTFDDKYARRCSPPRNTNRSAHTWHLGCLSLTRRSGVTRAQRCQGALAAQAGEAMKVLYDSGILGRMARSCGLRLALYLTPQDIQARFFDPYNTEVEGCPMYAPADVAYCVLTRA